MSARDNPHFECEQKGKAEPFGTRGNLGPQNRNQVSPTKGFQPHPQQIVKEEEIKENQSKIGCLKNGNVFENIANQYNCEISIIQNKIKIRYCGSDCEAIKAAIREKANSLPFDRNAKWQFLDNCGKYDDYETYINNLIESKYKLNYLIINSENYEDYQIYVAFERNNNKYNCYFAKPGGVHYQKMIIDNKFNPSDIKTILNEKDVEAYNFNHLTIRQVRRLIDGEEEKIELPLDFNWEWMHEDNNFRSYTYQANYIIEHCYRNYTNGGLTSFAIIQGSNAISYQIDFTEFKQYNEKTRFIREIRRVSR